MSLQNVAEHLASKGRHGDTMLMHVTPNEVNGLQALAKANGTSLTINPDTGMPEAFFLDSILPMAAGFALGPAGFGIMSSLGAAATVGGASALLSGDLGKGLSAGLGAFGGANLGSALANTGANATNAAASEAAKEAAKNTLAGADLIGTPITGPGLAGEAAPIHLANAGRTSASTGLTNLTAAQPGFNTVGAGVKDLFTDGGFGRLKTATDDQPGGFLGTAGSLLGSMALAPPPTMRGLSSGEDEDSYGGPYGPAERNVRFPGADRMSTSEFQYFDNVNPYPAVRRLAEGGEVGVEAPTAQNLQDPQYIQQLLGGFGLANNTSAGNAGTSAMDRGRALMPDKGYYYNTMGAGERNFGVKPVTVKAAPSAGLGGDSFFNSVSSPANLGIFGSPTLVGMMERKGFMPQGSLQTLNSRLAQQPTQTNSPAIPGYRAPTTLPIGGYGMSGFLSPLAQQAGASEEASNYTDLSRYVYDPATQQMVPNYAEGGEVNLTDGAFVLDARTVSEIGNGSSAAGQEILAQMGGMPIDGPGDGASDSIPASIDGAQAARVARDEVVFSPQAVQQLGGGDPNAGAKKLYDLMERAHSARKRSKRGADSGLGSLVGA